MPARRATRGVWIVWNWITRRQKKDNPATPAVAAVVVSVAPAPVMTPPPPSPRHILGIPNVVAEPRADAYGRIISAVRIEFERWQEAHPDYAGDERNNAALQESILGLDLIFDVLNDYEILHKSREYGDDECPDKTPPQSPS
jgi:hypothetical protein